MKKIKKEAPCEKWSRLFTEAQETLDDFDFKSFLCHAYGVATSHVSKSSVHVLESILKEHQATAIRQKNNVTPFADTLGGTISKEEGVL